MALNRGSQPKVLMLGWEYPPRFAGGLGKACQGFSQAMARQGADVLFVLPTFQNQVAEPSLKVIGAEHHEVDQSVWQTHPQTLRVEPKRAVIPEGLSFLSANTHLYSYGLHPEGPAPKEILEPFRLSDLPEAPPSHENRSSSRSTGRSSEIYGRNLWSEIERFKNFVSELAGFHQIDLVHAHDWMTFPAAFEFQKKTNAPVFLHVHATEYDRSGEHARGPVYEIERQGFHQATHIFTVSRYTSEVLQKHYGVDPKKITVIYNAPEKKPERKPLETRRTKATKAEKNVVFVGRLTFQKGPDHLLRAAALVASRDPDIRFIFCGTGDLLPQLRQEAAWLGITKQVQFTGFMDPEAVEKILEQAHLLVMPSVSEPFGLAALEAIDSGTPVILSKQSGVREVIHRSLQVDFWDHQKLADQIFAALRLKHLSSQLVEEGRSQMSELSWDKSATLALSAYRRHFAFEKRNP